MAQVNFGELVTEQRNPRTFKIDQCTTSEIVQLINDEDKKVASAVAECLPSISAAVDIIVERIKRGGRVFYVGAGTSGRIGALDSFECPLTFGVDPTLIQAIVAGVGQDLSGSDAPDMEDSELFGQKSVIDREVSADDVVIGISASGTAPFVLAAMKEAAKRGAFLISISNTPNSLLEKLASLSIVPITGPECITGSTRMKAGTSQKMILNMLSTAAMIKLGKVYQNLMVDLLPTNSKLVDRAIRIVMQAVRIDKVSATSLLQSAGDTKTAIVMGECGADCVHAKNLLKDADGVVSRAIELFKSGELS